MARYKFEGTFWDQAGNVVPQGTVSVFFSGTTIPASIYAASSGGSAVNFVLSGIDGRFLFYVDDGDYSIAQSFRITLSAADYATETYDEVNIFPAGGVSLATTILAGLIEIATQAEVDTGTATDLAVVPDTLAHSVFANKAVELVAVAPATDVGIANGVAYFPVTSTVGGMNLIECQADVITPGVTGLTTIMLYNLTTGHNMLSTAITIDSAEASSLTAAAPSVIDTSYDDVAAGDRVRVDVTGVSSTAPKGLIITMIFRRP